MNRQQSGLLLAERLQDIIEKADPIAKENWIVLALPCGGVPVGLEIAMRLKCPLNVIASKKIGAPAQPELAIGAVTSDGIIMVDTHLKKYLQVSQDYLNEKIDFLVRTTKEQESSLRRLSRLKANLDLKDKSVIVVDDGVATGMTAIAAAHSLRYRGAKQIIFATSVTSRQAYEVLSNEYDLVLALEIPAEFKSVGQFYKDFSPVEDLEVIRALSLADNAENVRTR